MGFGKRDAEAEFPEGGDEWGCGDRSACEYHAGG